jgi:hypothetical protein
VAAYSLPRDSDGYKAAIRSLAIKALPSLGMDTPEQIKSYRYDAQYSKDPAERYVAADIADYMESYYKSQQEKSNQTMAKLGEGTGPTMSEMIAENKRVKAELAALEKAEKGPLTEAEKEAAAEAEEEAIRNKAEAEIDEGPIGQAIAKIENGDIETKAQIRTFIKKLERDGTLDDVEDVREGLSDREQDASEVLDTLSGLLDDARDNAIDERFDELLEERAQEKSIQDTSTPPAEPATPTPYFGAEEINVLGKKIADMIELPNSLQRFLLDVRLRYLWGSSVNVPHIEPNENRSYDVRSIPVSAPTQIVFQIGFTVQM